MKLKDLILEKTRELFLTIGFKSVTMDHIANAMGISKKTIYNFFENKNWGKLQGQRPDKSFLINVRKFKGCGSVKI